MTDQHIQYFGRFKRPVIYYINVYQTWMTNCQFFGPTHVSLNTALWEQAREFNCIGRWKVTLK